MKPNELVRKFNETDPSEYMGSDEITKLRAENKRLTELLTFALAGLSSCPKSWGLDITHVQKIRRELGLNPNSEE